MKRPISRIFPAGESSTGAAQMHALHSHFVAEWKPERSTRRAVAIQLLHDIIVGMRWHEFVHRSTLSAAPAQYFS
jgi:hypothetical protein